MNDQYPKLIEPNKIYKKTRKNSPFDPTLRVSLSIKFLINQSNKH
jgi:hypothetical protein